MRPAPVNISLTAHWKPQNFGYLRRRKWMATTCRANGCCDSKLTRLRSTSIPRRRRRSVTRTSSSLLFLARRFEHVPRGIRQIEEVIEFARAAQPQAAINHHTFAVHVVRLIAQQIDS